MASGREVKCAAGGGGDGDRIGGVFFSSSDIGAAGEADRVVVGRRIDGNKLGGRKLLHHSYFTTGGPLKSEKQSCGFSPECVIIILLCEREGRGRHRS